MDAFDLDHEEIDEVLGSHWTMTLWGCAFEDFLTQAFEPDGRTFVDIYLKSRGFKETVAGLVDLRQENPTFWNWLGHPPAKGSTKPGHPDALVAGVTMEDGTPVLGNIEIKGRFLVLMVNSAQRAQRGGELVQNILGKMVRAPLTSIQTIEQLKAGHQGKRPSSDDIPPEVATPLVHAMLDKQYRATLDEPVGMLGDISPRAAARTKAGRQKVAEWLKYLEMRSSSGPDPRDPMATYDFGWIWEELGVEDLRR